VAGVSIGVWISVILIAIVITALTIKVTNLAYSRKWENEAGSEQKHEKYEQ
jgi:hypothetical protein